MQSRQLVLAVFGVAAMLAGGSFMFGSPRITLVNDAVWVDYPQRLGVAGLVAAAGAALVAAALSRRAPRILCAILALACALAGLDRLVYRLETGAGGLISHGLFGATRLAWGEITRVESGPDVVVVWGSGDAQIRVGTASFKPEQRAALDLAIARRVREREPGAGNQQ